MPTKVDVNLNNIIFESESVDPTTGHSIYVFDSTYLPSSAEFSDSSYELLLDKLIDKLVLKLPFQPFSLVVFSSGFSSNNLSWVQGIRMYSRLPRHNKNYLQKIYVVHESFFIRTLCKILENVTNLKFLNNTDSSNYLVHASNLSELAQHIDITKLRISLNVYLHDYKINEKILIPDKWYENTRKKSISYKEYRKLIFDKIFRRLRIEGPQTPLLFQKPGSYKKINILLGVIERRNYIDLSQWDIHTVGSVFLHFIKNNKNPLFPIDLLPLPIDDSLKYTYNNFVFMIERNGYYHLISKILLLLISILKNKEVTEHTYLTLSKCITAPMCKEKLSLKSANRLAIGARFIRNVLLHYNSILAQIEQRDSLCLRSKPIPENNIPEKLGSPLKNFHEELSFNPTESHNMLPTRRKVVFSCCTPSQNQSAFPHKRTSSLSENSIVNSFMLPTRGCPRKPSTHIKLGSNFVLEQTTPATDSNPVYKTLIEDIHTLSELDINKVRPGNIKPLKKESRKIRSISTKNLPNVSSFSSTSWNDTDGTGVSDSSRCRTKSAPCKKNVTQLESPENHPIITETPSTEIEHILLGDNINRLILDKNEKIQSFDHELRMRKLKTSEVATANKFSPDGYSDITTSNKVSKLASLYEQRLLGLQIAKNLTKE